MSGVGFEAFPCEEHIQGRVMDRLGLGSAQVLPSVARGVEADFGGLQIVVGPSWEVELVAYAAG